MKETNELSPEEIRRSRIAARDALGAEERTEKCAAIVRRITALPEFRGARTVMLYRAIRGEVNADALIAAPESRGKTFCFPLCVGKTEMVALCPGGAEAWHKGFHGIWEPTREKSVEIPPEALDLVVCPCTAFDPACGRMGMGAGFYDRFLPKCRNAVIIAAAFEAQKTDRLPPRPWDVPMDAVVTELETYRRNQ